MKHSKSLTEGNILRGLIGFALPVLLALFVQSLYGGVDLLIVGRFATTADLSGVATGSMLMHTVTMIITGFAMGLTILVGQKIGEAREEEAGKAIGAAIALFWVIALGMTMLLVFFAGSLTRLLHAPEEAFSQTVEYVRICGAGSVFIVAYNVFGGIFRGIGDSKTPFMTVCCSCVLNIIGDYILVGILKMGAAGAGIATVLAQGCSVLISIMMIRNRSLPFLFHKKYIRFDFRFIRRELYLGAPIALQEFLVGTSFLVIQSIVNSIGVIESAGVGVAEKVCGFIMLVPSAYMQSMAAFVAQNHGAGRPERSKKALKYGIGTSLLVGIFMAGFSFFKGNLLAGLFAKELPVILAAHDYLKAYAIDTMLTSIMFCMVGYFNGCGKTVFVMLQGLVGALLVRMPLSLLFCQLPGVTLFQIGLATPCATSVQILLCIGMMLYMKRKESMVCKDCISR